MAHAYVKVKLQNKVLKLRPVTVTVANLAMIFKLEVNQGIYIHSEEEGEIILPSDSGAFTVEEYGKTYAVNGEPVSSSTSAEPISSTSLGIPLSYQARTNSNPPPGQLHPERATFTVKKSQGSGWKKSFIVVEIVSSGHVYEKYQVHLTLKEERASVEIIEEMLRQQLGFGVCLLDSKNLPIMAGETTKGSQFWRSSRKILVAKVNEMQNLRKGKGRAKRAKTGILEQLRRMVAEGPDEDDDFVEHRSPTSEKPKAPSPEEEASKVLKSIFKCSICLSTVSLPAAACASCHAVMGCIPCVEQWHVSSANASKCPLCHTSMNYVLIPIVREISNLLGQPIHNSSEEGSDTDAIPYGAGDDDSSHLVEGFELHPML